MATNKVPRQEVSFTLTEADGRKLKIKMFDRINVDDIVLHFTHRRLHELITGSEQNMDLDQSVRDFLVKERVLVR